MDLSQSNARQPPFTGTQVLLTVLVSVALLGAVATQWVRRDPRTASPTASSTPRVSLNQQGMIPGGPSNGGEGVVFSRDYILWGYVATRTPSGMTVNLTCNCDTATELHEFAAMNKERALELAQAGGTVDVQVTFRSLLSPELFRKWVAASGMSAKFASLRLDAGGARGTLTIAGQGDDPLPQEALDASRGTVSMPLGVYSVRGFVPAGRLPNLVSNARVFVADVTPTLARLDLEATDTPGAKDASIHVASPFDTLEDLGLVEATP